MKVRKCRDCVYYVPLHGKHFCGRYADFKPDDPNDIIGFRLSTVLNADGKCRLFRKAKLLRRFLPSVRNIKKIRRFLETEWVKVTTKEPR